MSFGNVAPPAELILHTGGCSIGPVDLDNPSFDLAATSTTQSPHNPESKALFVKSNDVAILLWRSIGCAAGLGLASIHYGVVALSDSIGHI